MTTEPSLDPALEAAVAELRRPLDLGDHVDARVLSAVSRLPSPRSIRFRRRLGIDVLVAAAAVVVAVAGLSRVTSSDPGVRFALEAPAARSITVVGDFNDWNPAVTPLSRDRRGRWAVTLDLRPGRYRYGYLVNGTRWVADPVRPTLPDPDFGAPTSLVTVQESP